MQPRLEDAEIEGGEGASRHPFADDGQDDDREHMDLRRLGATRDDGLRDGATARRRHGARRNDDREDDGDDGRYGTRARLRGTRLKVARVEQPDRDGEVDEDGRADLSSMTWRITIWSLNHEDVTVGDNPEVDR